MPIYEFYCEPCNTIFNFFSRSVNTAATPACPRCGKPLERRMSMFACIDKTTEGEGGEPFLDETRLASAMGKLAAEAETLNEDDPRQAANLMRKFSEMTGVRLGDGMQEALQRMESGEDPDSIEADMGNVLDQEDPFTPENTAVKRKASKPGRDDTLYEL